MSNESIESIKSPLTRRASSLLPMSRNNPARLVRKIIQRMYDHSGRRGKYTATMVHGQKVAKSGRKWQKVAKSGRKWQKV
jgi:hypothetical protein